MACLALACAIGLARGASRYAAARAPTGSLRLETPDGVFAYRPQDGSLSLQPAAGGAAREGTLVVVYRGARMPLVLRRVEAATARVVRGDVALSAGAVALDAGVALEVDPSTGGLVVSLVVHDAAPPVDAGSGPELAFETAARDAFASGVGVLGDAASVQAPFVQFGDAPSLAVAA